MAESRSHNRCWPGSTVLAIVSLLLAGCGPAGPDYEPAGPLFEGLVVEVDPQGVVPFGVAPEAMAPTVVWTGEGLTLSPPDGTLAEGWEALAVVEGVARAAAFAPGELKIELPAKTSRAGVRAVRGALRGPVVWADGPAAGASGLGGRPQGLFFALDPPWGPQAVKVVSAQVSVSLFDASGDDLRGAATLLLEPVVPLDELALRLAGNVLTVRDGAGADLAFVTTASGLTVSFPATVAVGASLTIAITWAIPDLSQDRGGRTVGGATAELLYAGDGVAWFPRPEDTPSGASDLRFIIDAPETFTVFTGGRVTARTAGAAGRSLTRSELTWPLRAWPLLAAGVFSTESPTPELTLAALESGAPVLGPHASELAKVQAFYSATFGAIPGGAVAVVQVPDTFRVGFAGPGLLLVPTVRWDRPPGTWSRFLLFHELSHAWWGHASFIADLRDLWLIEGLADYSATRALGLVAGADAARAHAADDLGLLLRLVAEGYGGQPGRDVPLRPDDPALLQDYVFYIKGDLVLRYLEAIVGQDVFDTGWSAYAAATRFSDTRSDAFRDAMEASAGASLAWFFDAWLLETGFPALRYEPYFEARDGGVEISLGLAQVAGMSGDEARPWTLPLTWKSIDTDGQARAFAGCLDQAAALVAPDGARCIP